MPVAIQIKQYGSPDVLKANEVPVPTPAADEVVIKVIVSAVNRADCEIRSGKWSIQSKSPFPHTPGLETIGTIHSKGKNVNFSLGTTVITMMQKMGGIHGIRPGGYQEYVKVPANTLALVKSEVDPVALGTLGLAGITAYNGIRQLELKKDHRVIVMGATGGVGSIAVQLAKFTKAYVITPINSSRKKDDLLKLGVDEIWDLSTDPWENHAAQKVDGVFEILGGETFGKCVGLLKPKGRLCTIGALTGGDSHLSIWDLLHGLQITGWSSEDMSRDELQSGIYVLSDLLLKKQIHLPPVKIYPLSKAAQAHADMEGGKHVGRLLLKP